MYYTSIAKITFRRMTSLIKFIMAESPAMLDHIDPSLVNVSNVGVLATQPSIVILQPLPSSVQPSHGHSNCPEQSRVCQFVALIMYFWPHFTQDLVGSKPSRFFPCSLFQCFLSLCPFPFSPRCFYISPSIASSYSLHSHFYPLTLVVKVFCHSPISTSLVPNHGPR